MASQLVLTDFATKKAVPQSDIARYPVLAIGAISVQEVVSHAFVSEESFEAWLATTALWDELKSRGRLVSTARTHPPTADEVRRRFADESNQMSARVIEVSRRLNRPMMDRAVLIEAFGAPGEDPSVVYEGTQFSGASIWLPTVPVPDLNWIGWGRRIQSAQVIDGGLSLWDQTNWRGRKCYLFGFPFYEFPDLAQWDFDRIAQSNMCNAFDP